MNLRQQARAPSAPKAQTRSYEPALPVRLLPEERERIARAAMTMGVCKTDFIRNSALDEADRILDGKASESSLVEVAAVLKAAALDAAGHAIALEQLHERVTGESVERATAIHTKASQIAA